VSRGVHRSSAAPVSRLAHPGLPARAVTPAPAELPFLPILFPVCARGSVPARRPQGELARRAAPRSMPPVSSGRLRSRPLTS
jgi:hypothetical protein